MRTSTAVLLAVVLFSSAAWAQNDPAIEAHIKHVQDALLPPVLVKGEPPKTTKLSDRMAELHVPGVSIAVIHGGKLEWARGFGVVAEGGAPVTPDTLFQAASISKPISALAALRLAEAGKLDLDADVNSYLKSWKVPASKFTDDKKVTVRELLSHTAGMTVHGFPGYAGDAPLPTLRQMLDGEPPANTPAIRVDMPPASEWRYSGGGYLVLRQLLQDLTGKPFQDLMQETVLKPMGMSHSSYEQPLPPDKLAKAAMPYHEDGSPFPGGPLLYTELAPDGLWTTPTDLARYVIETQQSLAGRSNLVLSQEMTRQMLTEVSRNWGLGPSLGGSAEHRFFGHGGSNQGYKCEFDAYNDGDGVVIMTNGDAGYDLVIDIRRTIARDYGWPDFQPATHELGKISAVDFKRVAGTYRLDNGWSVTVSREGDRYFAQAIDEGREEILPENDHLFFSKEAERQFLFQAGGLTIHTPGSPDLPMKRLDAGAAKRIDQRLAARNKRVGTQTRSPDSEDALRRLLQEILQGKPDYARMDKGSAETIRDNLDVLHKDRAAFGDIASITFEKVAPNGTDVYDVRFAHGRWRMWIEVGTDKKILNLDIRLL